MSQIYSEETQEILTDLIDTLAQQSSIDPELLVELRQMMIDGELDNRTRIQSAIAILEAKADDLED